MGEPKMTTVELVTTRARNENATMVTGRPNACGSRCAREGAVEGLSRNTAARQQRGGAVREGVTEGRHWEA